ncbi:MAG: CxxC-x17-CxxC domain-containing protein [Candidatus Altiarchaeota archaeon]
MAQDQFGRDLHTTVCSKCGNEAQVPFKPTEGKPVYCRDCFRSNRRF